MPRDHPRPSSHDHRDLLEREAELAALAAAVDRARSDSGSVILVMGEAGVGKTSLIRAHLAALPPDVRVMTGAAEDLVSARALGPFREMFPAGVDLADADRVVSRLLADVHDGPGPVVVVIDDAHWADDASLDVVRSLSRRVHALPLVVVMALRHAELTVDHPLRRLLAMLTGPNTRRLELTGLSPAGVDLLAARAGVDPSRLA